MSLEGGGIFLREVRPDLLTKYRDRVETRPTSRKESTRVHFRVGLATLRRPPSMNRGGSLKAQSEFPHPPTRVGRRGALKFGDSAMRDQIRLFQIRRRVAINHFSLIKQFYTRKQKSNENDALVFGF